jgi:multidrug resistance protein MdtO
LLFISCVALAKYRLRFPGFELPEPVRRAENEFEESLAHTLDGMADRLEGKARQEPQDLETAFARLTDSVKSSVETPAALSANLQSFLPLSQRIAALAVSLDKEISS